jgi:hypothetical protein
VFEKTETKMLKHEEVITVVIKTAVTEPQGHLRLANAEGYILDDVERNRFNTERAIELYTIAIDNSVWEPGTMDDEDGNVRAAGRSHPLHFHFGARLNGRMRFPFLARGGPAVSRRRRGCPRQGSCPKTHADGSAAQRGAAYLTLLG